MTRSVVLALVALMVACSDNGNSGKIAPPDGGQGDKTGGGDVSGDACTPMCGGKECGDDGCGGDCGTCKMQLELCSESGQCVPFTCKSTKDCPGDLICADDLGECVACVGDEDCPEGTKCGADHACHEEHLCDSDKDCKQFDLVCDKDAGQCVQCLKADHCAEGEYCKDGYCIETACPAGEAKCEGPVVLVCAADGSGWSVSITCAEQQYCEAGECTDYACAPSETFCDGEVLKECSGDGKSVVSEDDCAAKEEHCFGGKCLATVCEPGAKFCADPATVATCLGDGMDFSKLPCDAGQYCYSAKGECVAQVCSPGKAECVGTVAKTCNAIGSGYASQVDCKVQSKVCVNGQCLDLACPPSTNFCVDNVTVGYCDEEGKSFVPEACEAKHSCEDGECKPWLCTPNLPVCDGQTATKCDALGLGPLPGGTQCLPGQSCVEGKCVDCVKDCAGKECGDDGCGGSCGSCTGDDACNAGICVPPGMDCNNDGADDQCPELPGYVRTCNAQQHCEYANQDSSGWKKWDVWIWIPPGSFMMGCSAAEVGCNDYEMPTHTVTFSKGYFIGKFEIVVAAYEACELANPTKCTPPDTSDWPLAQGTNTSANGKSDHPQNGLSWQKAREFCAWVAPGGGLPSEAQWEYAASGPVHRKYPWGAAPEPTCSNNTAVFDELGSGVPAGYGCGTGGTWKVGSKTAGASWSGALDMAGNAMEVCEDCWHGGYVGAPTDGSAWVDNSDCMNVVNRGGGFNDAAPEVRVAKRSNPSTYMECASNGARCVRPLPVPCNPSCAGKQCGDDGCGGSCGTCGGGMSCQGGQCKVVCGDGACGAGENQCNCTQDCKTGCSGCCTGAVCEAGTSNTACGQNGTSCIDCSASGKQCKDHVCIGQTTPTWTDPTTGLTWQNPPSDQTFTAGFSFADQACKNLSLDGGGWRLPTIDELRSLIRDCPATVSGGQCNVQDGACMQAGCMYASCNGCQSYGGPGAGGCYWPAVMLGKCQAYWSSSAVQGGGYNDRWAVHFSTAMVMNSNGATMYYLCVR